MKKAELFNLSWETRSGSMWQHLCTQPYDECVAFAREFDGDDLEFKAYPGSYRADGKYVVYIICAASSRQQADTTVGAIRAPYAG